MPKKGGNKKKKKLRKGISDPNPFGSKIQKQPPPEFERPIVRPPVRPPPINFGTLTSANTVFGVQPRALTERETMRREMEIKQDERLKYLRDRGLVEKMVDGKLKTVKFKRIDPVPVPSFSKTAKPSITSRKNRQLQETNIMSSPTLTETNRKPQMSGGLPFVPVPTTMSSKTPIRRKEKTSSGITSSRVATTPSDNIKLDAGLEGFKGFYLKRPNIRGPKPIVRSHTGIIRDTTSNSTAPSVLPRNFKVLESQLKPDGMDDAKRAMSGRGRYVDEVNHHKFGDSSNIGDVIGKEVSGFKEDFVSEDPTLQGADTTDEDEVFGSAEEGSSEDVDAASLSASIPMRASAEFRDKQMRLAQTENPGGANQPPARGAFETPPEILKQRKKEEKIERGRQRKAEKELKRQKDLLSQPDLQPEEDLGFMKKPRKPRADKGKKRGPRGTT